MKIHKLIQKLENTKNLTFKETTILAKKIIKGDLTNAQIAAILISLKIKGETVEEILGFIRTMQKQMKKIYASESAVDTCGTGGDMRGTFNISTASSLVVAACGVKVAKHGNRSVSSSCGSADVLQALGVNINLSPKQAEKLLKKTNFTFLFAPLYHPAMKNVACVRRELKTKTIFNFLGPFLSPAKVKRQIIGVPDMNIAKKLSKVARKLDYQHLLIVCSEDGLDEIGVSAPTVVFEIKKDRLVKKIISPEQFGFKRRFLKDISGGNIDDNRRIILNLLKGEKGAKKDVVVLNSACALYTAGKVKTIRQGIKLATESIDKRRAKRLLEKVIKISNKLT